ncbi:AN1-type zinc finger protein 2A-like [Coccinella septempunctata]|uniref:AN1-type zinc finger protein 2A-like n=1 Tax=Coccinella septempunctata TaxID=41139 RepID=UPI001D0793F8|nr:AN1-type zinc finger protein 2A-like [Coccinella septempunctata]
MEFPHLGKQCSEPTCKRLDFLPIKCDACNEIFCGDHYQFRNHNCRNVHTKDNQVPVCPLCNKPIPLKYGELPDLIVGSHIDNDCQSDPATNRRKVFNNRCSFKGCKAKEMVPIVCKDCNQNYCLKHRFQNDHKCMGKMSVRQTIQNKSVLLRPKENKTTAQPATTTPSTLQGNMSEDEALALALSLSMNESKPKEKSQEEIDFELAQQLQQEWNQPSQTMVGGSSNGRERCSVS